MEEGASYEKMAELVDSIESLRPGEEASIDVSEVFANRLAVKKISYEEADRLLEHVKFRPEVQQQVQPQPVQPRTQVPVPQRGAPKEAARAAISLRGMVEGIGKEFGEGIGKKVEEAKEAELVMPKLSVQDQLSDLEKIKEGIDENVFDKGQMKIIVDEIKGMSQISAREDTSKMSSDQRELVLMRNQRIKEIKGRLNIR